MARDHFAYVGAHRKCIDEIDQCKKEIWNIILDSKTDHATRIQALKEMHSLSKTYTLLIRDVPFITNISKRYDKEILNSIYNDFSYNKLYSNKSNSIINKNRIVDERNLNTIGTSGNQSNFADIQDSHITNTVESSNEYENWDDRLTKAILAQNQD